MAGKAIPGAIFGGTGITVSPEGIISIMNGATVQPFGSGRSVAINAAIVAANQTYESTGQQQVVRLDGLYDCETNILMKSGVVLDMAPGTKLKPTFSPALGLADDPTNALILAQATIGGTDAGTISATVRSGESTLTTSFSPTVDAYYLLRSTKDQTGYGSQTWHASSTIIRGELVKIKSVAGSGPYTVTLHSPVEQWHGSGSGLRTATPLLKMAILGGDLALEGKAGNPLACGIYIDGCIGLEIIISGAGASRALVNLRYCHRIRGSIFNRGENNSPLYAESSHDGNLEHDYQADSTLSFAHTNGIPRGLHFAASCMRWLVLGKIGRTTGIEFKGLCDSVFNITVDGCNLTERVSRDTTLFTGQGGNKVAGVVMNCSNGSSVETELPYALSGTIRVHDCTVPDASTNGLQFGVLVVDSIKHDFDRIEIINNGRNPGASGAYQNGLALYDSATYDCFRLHTLVTIGVQHTFTRYGGGNRFEIERWELTMTAGSYAGTIAINHGDTVAGNFPGHIHHIIANDAPTFWIDDHGGSTGVNFDSFRDFTIDRIDLMNVGTYDDVHVCLDVDVVTFAAGDFVEIVPPRSVTLANATDLFTLSNHGLIAGTPIYLGGTTLPSGYTAGTILYVSATGLTTNDFKVSLTLGGSVYTGFTSDGTALTFSTSYRSVRTPTDSTALNKGCRIMGSAISRHSLVAFGPHKIGRVGAVQVLNGDRIKTTNASTAGTVDNAHATPVGFAYGKPSASAGTVQLVN